MRDSTEVTAKDIKELVELAASSTDGLGASSSFVSDKAVCRRYLRAAATTSLPGPANTLPYLLATARWRDECQVETMLADRTLSDHERHLRTVLLYDLTVDHAGRPLMIERPGAWDVDDLSREVTEAEDEMVRAHVHVLEQIRLAVDGGGGVSRADRRAVLVFDMAGMGLRLLGSKTILRAFSRMSKLDADHYPETVGSIFVVNAPRAFSAAWAVAQPFVAEGTQKKVSVFSWAAATAAHEALSSCCGAACLPRELGGTRSNAPPYVWEELGDEAPTC